MVYNKLVRDKEVETMFNNGVTVKFRKAKAEELNVLLFEKMYEELKNLELALLSYKKTKITKAVSNLLIVLDGIRSYYSVSMSDVIYVIKQYQFNKINLFPNMNIGVYNAVLLEDIKTSLYNLINGLVNFSKDTLLLFGALQLDILYVLEFNTINKQDMVSVKTRLLEEFGGFDKGIILIETDEKYSFSFN